MVCTVYVYSNKEWAVFICMLIVSPPVPPVCSLDVKFTNQTLDFSSGLQVVTGRVDVCVNGSYSALCDVGFDIDDAVVGCNYFGYPSPYWGE